MEEQTELNLEQRTEIQMAKAGIKTRTELCKKLNISQLSLRRIFERNDCKLSLLLDMCNLLNCSLFDLTGR